MNAIKMLAVALIVAGALALAYGGFSYTTRTHETHVGPLDISVKDEQTVNIPIWAGLAAVLGGGLLLTFRKAG